MENNKDNNQSLAPDIKTRREENQEVDITIDEIIAEQKAGSEVASEEEVKVAIEEINPDESSMNSRG